MNFLYETDQADYMQAKSSDNKKNKDAELNQASSPPGNANEKTPFPVVGIGASAGGFEALEQFFTNMSATTGLAFVIIQHLDPTHKGIMPELLQRITPMKVFQAADNLKVKPNHVYVIPPNKSMSILHGSLQLFKPIETRGLRLPVDFFFRSLAQDLQEKSVGIILSGMGSDGSMGLRSIKEKAGLVLVQEPSTARFDGMPRSALEAGLADIVAPAGELPGRLISYLNHKPVFQSFPEHATKEKNAFNKIFSLLNIQTGHDFSMYKKSTVNRRIERRMGVHQIDNISSYVHYLQENPKEVEILFKELLIGVTSFFRDPAVWDHLKEKVLPGFLNKLPDGHILRVWIPGCSTGEEAYSLAIILKEALGSIKPGKNLSIQIFATDMDQDAIDKARKGYYQINIASDVSPERLNRFFNNMENNCYRISPEIREMVVFAPQDLIKDPPFTKLDILSCRNLLIYIEHELQNKLLKLFHYSLNPGGILLLGSAESIQDRSAMFKMLEGKMRIYESSGLSMKSDINRFQVPFYHNLKESKEEQFHMKPGENIQSLADQLLLQHFAPASVLVNETGDIIYITGRTGNYLEPAAGKANMNIFAMAREGLNSELPALFRKALRSYEKVTVHNIKVGNEGRTHYVDLTIQKIDKPGPLMNLVIVLFTDVHKPAGRKSVQAKNGDNSINSEVTELKADLQKAREELQNTIEEMQTSQEELKSTNEELQSTNEELQSANEELITSKEEMQSMNEELQTVNLELQNKVDDYTVMSNDMKNLLNSTDIATLFLDRDLHIRRYTNRTTKIFKLIQSDIGRAFTDLVTELEYPNLVGDAKEVLRTLIYCEKDVKTHKGNWFSVRIMPYRTYEDKIDGLVITFTDITKAKSLETELNKTITILRSHDLYNIEGKGKTIEKE